MASLKSLVTTGGTTQQILDGDTLIVGAGINAAGSTLAVGGAASTVNVGGAGSATVNIGTGANSVIAIGAATSSISIPGTVTSIGTTTFTNNATFQGNVTFGDASSDTVVFTSQVNSDVTFKLSAGTNYSGTLTTAGPGGTVSFSFTSLAATGAVKITLTDVPGPPGITVSNNSGVTPKEVNVSFNSAYSATATDLVTALTGNALLASFAISSGSGSTLIYATTATSSGGSPAAAQYQLKNVEDPSAAQDAATKNYVDTQSVASFSAGSTGFTPSSATKGAVTLAGTLNVANGGTGQTSYTNGQLLIGNTTGNTLTKSTLTAGSGVSITNGAGSITIAATGSGGTVTSVDVSGGTTGLTTSGGPVTGSGTITLGGTLAVANGGTGATTLTGYVSGNGTSAFTASATIPGSDISGNISGNAANVTGVVAVANGGTGATTLTSGSLLKGNGTGTVAEIAPGSNGEVLTVVAGAWAAAAIPAATDYSVITLTTSATAGTPIKNDGTAAQATSAANSRVVGVASATNTAKVLGIVNCLIETSITISAGDVVYLSAAEAGKVTNVAPSTATQVVAELGIARANGSGAGGNVDIVWQPKSIVVL